MSRPRRMTDMYLAAVEKAVADPGRWIDIPRTFKTEFNASITGHCLREGYLRVDPREGDRPIRVRGKTYIRTPAPVEARVIQAADLWRLQIRT